MKKAIRFFLSIAIGMAAASVAIAEEVKIIDFGAKADGLTLNTASIQAAIDFVSAKGGGKVIFTPGDYVTGTFYIKSGVKLELQKGASILGSYNPWDYIRDATTKWTSLIFSVGQKDIGIIGEGTIDGRGYTVAINFLNQVHLGFIEDPLSNDRVNEMKRPEIIHFYRCEGIVVSGIALKNSGCWTQQYDQCRNILLENVNVDSKNYWNNDGFDFVDCSDVVARNVYVDAADDAFCFKSHADYGVSENVLVENCVGRTSANGIKFGTMTLGTFRHFRFKNIKIYDTYRSAIEIATVDGGSVEDVVIDSVTSIHTGNPIFIRIGSRREPTSEGKPYLKDIVIKNVYAEVPLDKPDAGYSYEGPIEDQPRNVCPSIIFGLPDVHIENVKLENIEIVCPGHADTSYAYWGSSKAELDSVPELEKRYPEFSNWKELPAWGFYIRHADGLEFNNVRLKVAGEDYRPAIVADDVNGLRLKDLKVTDEFSKKGKKQIVTKDVKNLRRR